jgi:hypothetical protein
MSTHLFSGARTRPTTGARLGSDPFQLPVRDPYANRSTIVASQAPRFPPLYRPLPRLCGDSDSTSTSLFRPVPPRPARPLGLVKREAEVRTRLGNPLSKKEMDELCRVNDSRQPAFVGPKYSTPSPTAADLSHIAPRKSAALLFCDIVGGGM